MAFKTPKSRKHFLTTGDLIYFKKEGILQIGKDRYLISASHKKASEIYDNPKKYGEY